MAAKHYLQDQDKDQDTVFQDHDETKAFALFSRLRTRHLFQDQDKTKTCVMI